MYRRITVAATSVLLPAITAVAAVAALHAPYLGPADTSASTAWASKTANVPAWRPSYAAQFPGCTGREHLTKRVLIEDQDAHVRVVSFDAAWHASHDATTADDVWVLGWCD